MNFAHKMGEAGWGGYKKPRASALLSQGARGAWNDCPGLSACLENFYFEDAAGRIDGDNVAGAAVEQRFPQWGLV